MALYDVTRNDDVQPGEFVHAIVVASGTAQARGAVGHMTGVTKKNVTARKIETANQSVKVLSTYFDEREPESTLSLRQNAEAADPQF
ncbi:hypothetical protein [Streptomyces narbonensis]|uniref:hypothetical protein n=1 Tax=Streptomyces narbonensis TaxID=67333 RepID=UPI0033D88C69